ncbi:MAG TPA: GFA family protein [Caulobacteraceae bacterium]|nr:GFA family protein [Caulobacteraceae bacterium]
MIRTLSCHCGAVRLKVNAELGEVGDRNCSTCGRYGMLHWKVKPEQVRLATPRSGLSTYVWRFVTEGAHFCKTCGVIIARTGPDSYLSINARLIDDIDVHALKVSRYDGRSDIPGGDVPPLAESG